MNSGLTVVPSQFFLWDVFRPPKIRAFARVTGSYVIAEGIEDRAMLDFVALAGRGDGGSPGIHGAQGYLLLRSSEELPTAEAVGDVGAILSAHAGSPVVAAPPTASGVDRPRPES